MSWPGVAWGKFARSLFLVAFRGVNFGVSRTPSRLSISALLPWQDARFQTPLTRSHGYVFSHHRTRRATRARSVRMLSAGPLSGLSRPASGSQPLSALAPGGSTSAPGFTHLQQQQQQCRSLSIQSEDNQESTEELGAAEVEGAAAEAAVDVGGAAQAAAAEEEVGGSATSTSDALYLVQVDGLPFNMPQEEIEQWFADAGCAATSVTVPLWSEKSMRAGQNKGKAYIHLDNEEDTQAVLSLSGRSIGQRWISVSRLAIPLEEVRRPR